MVRRLFDLVYCLLTIAFWFKGYFYQKPEFVTLSVRRVFMKHENILIHEDSSLRKSYIQKDSFFVSWDLSIHKTILVTKRLFDLAYSLLTTIGTNHYFRSFNPCPWKNLQTTQFFDPLGRKNPAGQLSLLLPYKPLLWKKYPTNKKPICWHCSPLSFGRQWARLLKLRCGTLPTTNYCFGLRLQALLFWHWLTSLAKNHSGSNTSGASIYSLPH